MTYRQMKRLIFSLIEADYALKYVDSDYTLDVVNDIGLSKDALADQYQYTKDIVTDSKGVQKGYNMAGNTGIVRIQTFHCKRCSRHG